MSVGDEPLNLHAVAPIPLSHLVVHHPRPAAVRDHHSNRQQAPSEDLLVAGTQLGHPHPLDILRDDEVGETVPTFVIPTHQRPPPGQRGAHGSPKGQPARARSMHTTHVASSSVKSPGASVPQNEW